MVPLILGNYHMFFAGLAPVGCCGPGIGVKPWQILSGSAQLEPISGLGMTFSGE